MTLIVNDQVIRSLSAEKTEINESLVEKRKKKIYTFIVYAFKNAQTRFSSVLNYIQLMASLPP